MNAAELLTRADTLGIALLPDGADLVVRFEQEPPKDFVEALRVNKPAVLALLARDISDDPVACRGCAAVIPAGTTLCTECGAARSPLVKMALEMVALTNERSLRGRALALLDRRNYPRLTLSDKRVVGPGLLAWCPVLREAGAGELAGIIRVAEKAKRGQNDD